MKKGKFIVIDGTDGSGKATQVDLLDKRLKKEGQKVASIDFPRYYDNFFGEFIGKCLAGHYKGFLSIHPKIVSILYAADRFESSEQINKWLKKGYVVIADRYASSNQIHQGGKITNSLKRRDFLKWLDKMEYEIFKIPRPDLVIYLDVPVLISQKLLNSDVSRSKKKYLGGRKDIAEKDIKHLENARKSALKLVKEFNNFIKINCSEKGKIFEREIIHEKVFQEVKKVLK